MPEQKLIPITFVIDGACAGNGAENSRMGCGIVATAGKFSRQWSIPLGPGTNNRAEILALVHALKKVGERSRASITVYTDSKLVVGWISQDWACNSVENAHYVDQAKALVRECGQFRIFYREKDASIAEVDRLAKAATRQPWTQGPRRREVRR